MSDLRAVITILLSVSSLRSAVGTVTQDESSQTSPMTCNSCCQGPTGLNGVPGVPGVPGGFGPPGPVGPKGDIGISLKGDKGEIGGRGLSGLQGPRGSPGGPGKVGPKGDIGISLKGDKGEVGDMGLPGLQGPRGSSGGPGTVSPVPRFSGFTVVKTSSQSTVGVVTFEDVVSNTGHFETSTHKFVCQIPGYYLFTFSIGTRENNYPFVDLKKNGVTIVNAYTHPPSTYSSYRNMGTNSALLQLAAGDEVWLHNRYGGSGQGIYAISAWKWTTFSGVLLHET